MPFDAHDEIQFEQYRYTIPPARPGVKFPYEAEGGRGTVIRTQRLDDHSLWALKVFKPRYRNENQVEIVKRLEAISGLSGLQAARQTVIPMGSPVTRQHPELEWSVLMPWVEGDTWGKMLGSVQQGKSAYNRHEVEALALKILEILTDLEARRIVHCDLSSGNLLVTGSTGRFSVQLVDLEDMLIGGSTPASTTSGSLGYALPGVVSTACAEGDRYAGAILIAEALALSLPFNERILSPDGVFRGNRSVPDAQDRFNYVCEELRKWKPRFADLLRQAWNAHSLQDCAPFSALLSSLTVESVGKETGHVPPPPLPLRPNFDPPPPTVKPDPPKYVPDRTPSAPVLNTGVPLAAMVGVSIALAIFVILTLALWSQWSSTQNQLNSGRRQITELRTHVTELQSQFNDSQDELTKANDQIADLQKALDYNEQRDVQCTLAFDGFVGSINNPYHDPIHVNIHIERPSDGSSKSVNDINISGGSSTIVEGWAFLSGDKITVSQPGYRPLTWTKS